MRRALLCFFLFVSLAVVALADSSEFRLGSIEVSAKRDELGQVPRQIGSKIEMEEIKKKNRTDVAEAVNLLSGTSLSTNQRNEKTISVRGFDSRQVPLFIDGIPVYVPYDGYVDLGRFTTSDLSAIEVSKGFSSVAYGANTLGGAINLISRKPRKNLEADLTLGYASGNERRASLNVGTLRKNWFIQSSASRLESDGFPLSQKFNDTPTENGGIRNNSSRKDDKVSVKVGLVPNRTDEYAVSFYRQLGVKGQPPSTDPARARYWKWPYWNKESLYFISQTKISGQELLKLRLYEDRFDNKINTYTDDTYRTLRTSGAGSVSTGQSIYQDRSLGGSINLSSFRIPDHELTFVHQTKLDEHREFDATDTKNTFFKDTLSTYAVEDQYSLSESITMSFGLACHELRPGAIFSRGNPYRTPENQGATDVQAGLFYGLEDQSQIYGTIAQKSRMPTLRDRYSQRLSTFVENPTLGPEKATNLELGFRRTLASGTKTEAALFDSELDDKIQAVTNVQGPKSQMKNIGEVRIYGGEFGLRTDTKEKLTYQMNYTHTFIRSMDDGPRVTDVPKHKLTTSMAWKVNDPSVLTVFMEYNSRRWVSDADEIPGFTIVNLKFERKFLLNFLFEAGINNISDRNYELALGFPAPGRVFFTQLTAEY